MSQPEYERTAASPSRLGYGTIVLDPPWPMPSGGPASKRGFAVAGGKPSTLPYPAMPLHEIAVLPVSDLAATHAHLYVWTVNAFLEATYELVRGWGFNTSQVLTWAKTPRGLGMGGAFTNTTEFVLFGWRGSCSPQRRVETSWWNWRRGEHSAKPEAFLDLVEQVSPAPRLEMFSRRARLGWDTWGDEALHGTELIA